MAKLTTLHFTAGYCLTVYLEYDKKKTLNPWKMSKYYDTLPCYLMAKKQMCLRDDKMVEADEDRAPQPIMQVNCSFNLLNPEKTRRNLHSTARHSIHMYSRYCRGFGCQQSEMAACTKGMCPYVWLCVFEDMLVASWPKSLYIWIHSDKVQALKT